MNFAHWFTVCAGISGTLLLLLTPGAWIAFGLPLRAIPFWARLFTGISLSPLLICGQFFLVRWTGLPFETTVIVLIAINLPGLWLILKNVPDWRPPAGKTWLVGLSVLVPCIVLMSMPLLSMRFRI